uniref:HMG box domain-containing protein n=1 Tax=Amphora coffeiformis TaxID=265554 RepID=A0A7S3L8R2_9STRA|mmetsp:Transcript_11949/g.22847  ORF Transcript_11949/g.22847 Transcript_11949/m.22847 type:complete len:377 (+) Transcript_11949:54-1184(+)
MKDSGPDDGIVSVVSSEGSTTDQTLTEGGVNEDPQVFHRDPATPVVVSLLTSSPKPRVSAEEETVSTGKSAASSGPEPENLLDRPKRPLSAYNLFFRDQRECLLKTLPPTKSNGRGHGKISFRDLGKMIGSMWKEIDPQEKARYEVMASQGREKYRKSVEEWKDQQKANGLPTKSKKKVKRKVSSNSLSSKAIPKQQQQPFSVQNDANLPIIPIEPLASNALLATEKFHNAAPVQTLVAATSHCKPFHEEPMPFDTHDHAMIHTNHGFTRWEAGRTQDPLPTLSAHPTTSASPFQSGSSGFPRENSHACEPTPIESDRSMYWNGARDVQTGPGYGFMNFSQEDLSETFEGDVFDPVPFPEHQPFRDHQLSRDEILW